MFFEKGREERRWDTDSLSTTSQGQERGGYKGEEGGGRGGVKVLKSFTVHGPLQKQGEFMMKVGMHWDDFKERRREIMLTARSACLFRRGRIGRGMLSQLVTPCKIEFIDNESMIEILAPFVQGLLSEAAVAAVETDRVANQVYDIILKLNSSSSATSSASEEKEKETCCFCQSSDITAKVRLRLCGHVACKDCLTQYISTSVQTRGEEIRCGAKNGQCEYIAYSDIHSLVDRNTLEQMLSNGIRDYLDTTDNAEVILCPTVGGSCNALLRKENSYKQCTSCFTKVCTACGACSDSVHDAIAEDRKAMVAPEACDISEWLKVANANLQSTYTSVDEVYGGVGRGMKGYGGVWRCREG